MSVVDEYISARISWLCAVATLHDDNSATPIGELERECHAWREEMNRCWALMLPSDQRLFQDRGEQP